MLNTDPNPHDEAPLDADELMNLADRVEQLPAADAEQLIGVADFDGEDE